jgi:hypothetical protein
MLRLPRVSTKARLRKLLGPALAVVLALPMTISSAAAAGPWYVDGNVGNDANSCTSPGPMACRTIQAAVNKASAGDTINVAAGLYPEVGVLTINKTLTLLGANAGADARGVRVAESIVTDPGGTAVAANGVVIDGFTIENSVSNAFTGYGIWMEPATTGTHVVNNIIQMNIVGINISNNGTSQVLIQHNLIQNNNQAGPATGQGIYTDEFTSGHRVNSVLVSENTFKGNNVAGIDVSQTDAANGVFGLDVSANSFDGNGRAVLLYDTHQSTIHNNSITNSTEPVSAAIRILDNNTDLSIMNNNLVSGLGRAIRLTDTLGMDQPGAHPSSNVVINKNNIGATSNSFLTGLTVDAGSHVGTVNAICNWWGSPTGPTNASNLGGNGEAVVGDANFKPWWTVPSQTSPCPAQPKCKPGEEDHGNGDVQDSKGHHGHMDFDECDENHEFSHQDSEQNVDFHSSSGDHTAPQFDANLPVATTTGHGLNNGQDVTYVLVVTQLGGPGLDLYSLTLSDASGPFYSISGTLIGGAITVSH